MVLTVKRKKILIEKVEILIIVYTLMVVIAIHAKKGMLQQQMEDAKRILSIVLHLMVIHVLNAKAIIN